MIFKMAIMDHVLSRELPLEFFFFDQLRNVMGGRALYFTGLYLYATDCTKEGNRASR